MDDTSSVFYIPELLQRVKETLSISPMYSTEELKQKVIQEFNNRFASDDMATLDTSEGSPIDLLVNSAVELIESAVSVGSMTCNQLNLNNSQGSFLDTIASLFRLTRKYKLPTRVYCRFWGQNFTTIPSGSIVSDNNNHTFYTEEKLIISRSSTNIQNAPSPYYIDGCVVCTEKGAIEVPAGSITKITTGVLGWESVSNSGYAGETGQDEESDSLFRVRIKKCNYCGSAYVKSITSRINLVLGVKHCLVYENGTSNTVYIDDDGNKVSTRPQGQDYPAIMPHSVLVVVDGGDQTEIATAIRDTITTGANMTPLFTSAGTEAATSGVIVDSAKENSFVKKVEVRDENYQLKYNVVYNTGVPKEFYVKATVLRGSFKGSTSELVRQVKEAIENWQNGGAYFVDGLTLGQSVYKYEVSAAISDAIPEIIVKEIKLFKKIGGSWTEETSNHITVKVYEKAISRFDDNQCIVEGETNVP